MAIYLSHPQVKIEPDVLVPDWQLSEIGRQRAETLALTGWLKGISRIVSSDERKALETASIIAASLGIEPEIRRAMHENDRSATGFLKGPEFEAMADRFFTQPEVSVCGWERAVDAQGRIVREVKAALEQTPEEDVLFVGHGAVGTLLYCYLAGQPIDRRFDQPAGGGSYFRFAISPPMVEHHWRIMEEPPSATNL